MTHFNLSPLTFNQSEYRTVVVLFVAGETNRLSLNSGTNKIFNITKDLYSYNIISKLIIKMQYNRILRDSEVNY